MEQKNTKYYVNESLAESYTFKEAGKDLEVFPFVLSSENIDRQYERMILKPKFITNFKKNPVMFFNHHSRDLPIGEWKNIRIEDGLLKADAWFHEIDELSQRIKQYVAAKQLKATSIGFMSKVTKREDPPDELKDSLKNNTWRDSIIVHQDWDLLEASIVGMPANPDALAGKSMDLQPEVLKGINELFGNPEPVINFIPAEVKAGAVLNKKNKDKLVNAKALIDEVIKTAETEGAPDPDKAYEELVEAMQAQINDLKGLVELQGKQLTALLNPEPEPTPEPKMIPIKDFLNRQ